MSDSSLPTSSAPPAPSRPGPKRRLHEDVFEAIAEDILSGRLAAGTTVAPDAQLSTRFDVSRTVVREAIQSLANVGLIDVRHGAGTYVNDSAKWNILDPALLRSLEKTGAVAPFIDDLLDIRRVFEVEAVVLASKRATDDEVARLQALVDEMQTASTQPVLYRNLNLEFHSLIVEASHNRILQNLRAQLRGVLGVIMNARQKVVTPEMQVFSTAMHQMIVDSIRERRPDRAQAIMLTHIQGNERTLQQPGADKLLSGISTADAEKS